MTGWLEEEVEGCHGTLLARARRGFYGWVGRFSQHAQTVMVSASYRVNNGKQLLHESGLDANTRTRTRTRSERVKKKDWASGDSIFDEVINVPRPAWSTTTIYHTWSLVLVEEYSTE
jgi:hypothetical protein